MEQLSENVQISFGDCFSILPNIPSGSIDLIATDVPYSTTQNKWDSIIPFNEYIVLENKVYYYQDFVFYWLDKNLSYQEINTIWNSTKQLGMWQHVKRILKPNGVFLTTASQPFTSKLVLSNLEWFKYCWVWEKSHSTGFLDCKKKPMKQHEDIVVFYDKPCTY